MSRISLFFLFLYTHQLTSFCFSQDGDEMELLKCKINDLQRDYKELKDDNQKLTIKQLVDIKQLRLEKDEEIKQLKKEQEYELNKVKAELSNMNKSAQHLINELKSHEEIEIKKVQSELGNMNTTSQKEIEELNTRLKKEMQEIKELKLQQEKEVKNFQIELSNLNKSSKHDIEELESKQEKESNKLNAEIGALKTSSQQQNYSLMAVKRKASKLSTYCKLLSAEVCGPCVCMDDYQLETKYYCDCQHLTPKRDCREFYDKGQRINGLYKVHNNHLKLMTVYCDHVNDNGGWAVIQRRIDGRLNFYRNWKMYKNGFGNPNREFWLGNDNIHVLTTQSNSTELRIEMKDWNEVSIYAKYSSFQVEKESAKYRIHVAGYTGNHGDSLSRHNNHMFSTYDRDNDVSESSCSRLYRGAWWYDSCYESNLNGEYRWFDVKQPAYARGVIWRGYKGYEYSMKTVEIKVRRKV